jgi:hypothetical protein
MSFSVARRMRDLISSPLVRRESKEGSFKESMNALDCDVKSPLRSFMLLKLAVY